MTEKRVNNIGVFLRSLHGLEKEQGERESAEALVRRALSSGSRGISDLLRETRLEFSELEEAVKNLTGAGLVRQNELKEFELTEEGHGP
jgi:predicted transcriptional regulator